MKVHNRKRWQGAQALVLRHLRPQVKSGHLMHDLHRLALCLASRLEPHLTRASHPIVIIKGP